MKTNEDAAVVLRREYGSVENFLSRMNPDLQSKAGCYPERAFFGTAPTLATINKVWGMNTAKMWLLPQLNSLAYFCGVREKMTDRVMEELADIISTEWPWLKTSELMLFFYRFKTGRFGRFYGAIDPMIITGAIRDFVKERAIEIDKRESSLLQQKLEESKKTCITYDEWIKLKK